jgi:hypothetical protein
LFFAGAANFAEALTGMKTFCLHFGFFQLFGRGKEEVMLDGFAVGLPGMQQAGCLYNPAAGFRFYIVGVANFHGTAGFHCIAIQFHPSFFASFCRCTAGFKHPYAAEIFIEPSFFCGFHYKQAKTMEDNRRLTTVLPYSRLLD